MNLPKHHSAHSFRYRFSQLRSSVCRLWNPWVCFSKAMRTAAIPVAISRKFTTSSSVDGFSVKPNQLHYSSGSCFCWQFAYVLCCFPICFSCSDVLSKYVVIWLVVSTPLKNICQLGLPFPLYGQNNPHVLNHQPVMHFSLLPVLCPVFDSRPPRPKKQLLRPFHAKPRRPLDW